MSNVGMFSTFQRLVLHVEVCAMTTSMNKLSIIELKYLRKNIPIR